MKNNIILLIIFSLAMIFNSCTQPQNMTVLISMLPAQEEYFKNEVIPSFAKENNVKIDVVHYNSVDSVDIELSKRAGKVDLVKVPFSKSWSLVEQNQITAVSDIISLEKQNDFNNTYLLTALGRQDDKQYYVPRKFETRIMVYRKSKVKDAILNWRKYKDDIDNELKKFNGYGLPVTYILENDPGKWDFFDIFVAGWVWAHTSYDGKKIPRVAHRGKHYSGTALRVIDRAFECGADSNQILTMSGNTIVDSYEWEAIYAYSGIYNPRMWKESWSGSGVWKGFSENEVFLSFMTQLDCFFIHGTGRDGLNGYLSNPEDMGVSVMPTGCSVEINKNGNVLRKGTKSITTGGWWWGIPRNAPNSLLSYKLARHITSTENQIQGCSRFGMIPVRKDILSDMSMLFGGGWITQIYNVSFKQLMENKRTVLPHNSKFDKIQRLYLDAWFDIVVHKHWSSNDYPNRMYIKQLIATKYACEISKLK